MIEQEGYIRTAQGLRLYYRQIGDGPNCIIIPLASSLADDCSLLHDDHTLIFYDQRGRGQSDPVANPDWISFEHEVHDLEQIRQHFQRERVALLGWSYLGAVSALYAARYPLFVERLVLMCPMPPRSHFSFRGASHESEAARQKVRARTDQAAVQQLEKMKQAGLDRSDPISYCRLYKRIYSMNMMGKPSAVDSIQSDPCRYPNEWPEQSAQLARMLLPNTWDWRTEASTVTVPTLVVHGAEDALPLAGSQEWLSALGNARLLLIPGAGHFPHVEAPEHFWPPVTTFLNGAWPAEAESPDAA